MCGLFAIFYTLVPVLLPWIAFDSKVVEMEQSHLRGNFHLGFDASHLLHSSTNRFFQVNGKQPRRPRED